MKHGGKSDHKAIVHDGDSSSNKECVTCYLGASPIPNKNYNRWGLAFDNSCVGDSKKLGHYQTENLTSVSGQVRILQCPFWQ